MNMRNVTYYIITFALTIAAGIVIHIIAKYL